MKKNNKEQIWDEFIQTGRDEFFRPFDDLDEMYMTDKQKHQLYKEATEELGLKLKILQKQKQEQKQEQEQKKEK